jgi:hypothetical protein
MTDHFHSNAVAQIVLMAHTVKRQQAVQTGQWETARAVQMSTELQNTKMQSKMQPLEPRLVLLLHRQA